MTKVLDQAVGTLARQVDALEATTRAAQAVPLSAATAAGVPEAAPGLGPHTTHRLIAVARVYLLLHYVHFVLLCTIRLSEIDIGCG